MQAKILINICKNLHNAISGPVPIFFIAIGFSNREIIQAFIDRGTDVNLVDDIGCSALEIVADNSLPRDDQKEVMELLLKNGANVRHNGGRGLVYEKESVVWNPALFELLMNYTNPNDIDFLDNSGVTLLFRLCLRECFDACRMLIKAGAKFFPEGVVGFPMYLIAMDYNKPNMIPFLVEQGVQPIYEELLRALLSGKFDLAKPLYDVSDDRVKYLNLLYFMTENQLDNVRRLLDFGADPNHIIDDTYATMNIAGVDEGSFHLDGNIAISATMYPIMTNNLELTDLLLQYGGDVHRANISMAEQPRKCIITALQFIDSRCLWKMKALIDKHEDTKLLDSLHPPKF